MNKIKFLQWIIGGLGGSLIAALTILVSSVSLASNKDLATLREAKADRTELVELKRDHGNLITALTANLEKLSDQVASQQAGIKDQLTEVLVAIGRLETKIENAEKR